MNQYDIILHQADDVNDWNTLIVNLSNVNSKNLFMYADNAGVPRVLSAMEYVDLARDHILFDIDLWTHTDSTVVKLGHLSGQGYGAVGTGNTTIGSQAGENITAGSGNICLGQLAGTGLTTGHQNIVIGSGNYPIPATLSSTISIGKARPDASHRLVIDSESTTTPLLYGEFDNDFLKVNGDVEITQDLKLSGIEIGTIAALLCRDSSDIVRMVEPSSPIANIIELGTGAQDLEARQKINAILTVLRAKKIINT